MIKQILNPGQIIQTELAVDVDGIRVNYYRLPGFIYLFAITCEQSQVTNVEVEAVNQVIETMISQSCDHGFEWRETGVRDTSFNPRTGVYTVTVYFRITDSHRKEK